jgi:hypothetical protein
MRILPRDFGAADLKVYTDTGDQVGVGARVWIIGTLENEPGGASRTIEVQRILAG